MIINSINNFYIDAYKKKKNTSENLLKSPTKDFKNFIGTNKNSKMNESALEMGYGYGNYTIYIARIGYCVTAVDAVPASIFKKRIHDDYYDLKNKIEVICDDLNDYKLTKNFDLILSRNTLHYLNFDAIKNILIQSENNTNFGGINYFEIFSDIKRSGKIDPNLSNRESISSRNLQNLFQTIYNDWEYKIQKTNYKENTTNYEFKATRLIFKGRKRRE